MSSPLSSFSVISPDGIHHSSSHLLARVAHSRHPPLLFAGCSQPRTPDNQPPPRGRHFNPGCDIRRAGTGLMLTEPRPQTLHLAQSRPRDHHQSQTRTSHPPPPDQNSDAPLARWTCHPRMGCLKPCWPTRTPIGTFYDQWQYPRRADCPAVRDCAGEAPAYRYSTQDPPAALGTCSGEAWRLRVFRLMCFYIVLSYAPRDDDP